MNQLHPAPRSTQACMDMCTQCHQTCLHEALQFGLKAGGKHTETDHFRLMMNCAEICQTSANFQLSDSPYGAKLAALCAEICTACADSCEQLGDMPDVVEACRQCAQCCTALARSQGVLQ
ncbi:MAG TPA: four-helix bundle copper-binding protein [Burkholderiaceae bacterium]